MSVCQSTGESSYEPARAPFYLACCVLASASGLVGSAQGGFSGSRRNPDSEAQCPVNLHKRPLQKVTPPLLTSVFQAH